LLSGADAATEPPSPEKLAQLKADASAAGSEVAQAKKANAEALKSKDTDAKAAATAALKPYLERLSAAKKLVEEAEDAAANVGGLPRTKEGKIDYSKDFFGQPVNLTVSGQLQGEIYACALTSIYTFGPTFRAENSHTSRHLAEFWMIEPEIAFADLYDNMQCAEDYVRFCCKCVLEECFDDLQFLSKMYDPQCIERVRGVVSEPFARCSYTEAVEILQKAIKEGKKFENMEVEWGMDFGSEHERYLSEVIFKRPVVCFNYPKAIKAFYMRENDDGKTVASMDVLVPGVGELIGGSQREERFELLQARMDAVGLDREQYEWYTDLRKYGTCVHSGFGLGFERLILFTTGMENIRDVIPFPRWPGNARG
jgi:asparaginyl-tRNA synthetase